MSSYSSYLRLNLHVDDSDMTVIRASQRRMKKSVRHNPTFRAERKTWYRLILGHHREARSLYNHVMLNTNEDC